MIRTILLDIRILIALWTELAYTAVYLHKRLLIRALKGLTVYKISWGERSNLQHLKMVQSTIYSYKVEIQSSDLKERKKFNSKI
jgi:hypothetical protein